MKRFLTVFIFVATFLGCASPGVEGPSDADRYSLPGGSIVLRVEVIDVEFTDFYPGCGDVQDCVPFDFWHKYRARVKSVISGDWPHPEVEFTYLQHAKYINKVTRDCYVVLEPAPDELRSKLKVPFVADKLLSRFFERDRAAIKALRDGT
jgi:hypothetical protein